MAHSRHTNFQRIQKLLTYIKELDAKTDGV